MNGINELIVEHLLKLCRIDMLDLNGEDVDLRSELTNLLRVGEAAVNVLRLAVRAGQVVDLLGRRCVTHIEQTSLPRSAS